MLFHQTHPKNRQFNTKLFFVASLFFLSGAAGLIYEIVWERLLELYFGVTMTSITLIVSAYMAGLGLGSLIGGRLALRIKRLVLTYGLVEAAIGLFGLFSPSLITWIGLRTAGSHYLFVFWLSFVILLVPTLLMGLTLPLLTQSFVERVESSGHIIGLLYGINTLGAAFGALVSGYILIGWLGFDGATKVAVALNLSVGIGAILLYRKREQLSAGERRRQESSKSTVWPYPIILSAAFLVGFIDLGFEMLWFRVLGILNKTTAYSFPTVLFVFLTGLALGGWIWGRKADESRDAIGLFWKLQLSVGVVTVVSVLVFWGALHLPPLEPRLHAMFSRFQQPVSPFVLIGDEFVFSRRLMLTGLLEYFLPVLVLVLPASVLMGGGLPVLDRIAIHSAEVSGRRVGDIHLTNILGSAAGSLAISFIFLPSIGSEATLKTLALLTLIFAGMAWKTGHIPRSMKQVGLPVALLLLLFLLPDRGEFYRELYKTGTGVDAIVHESGESVLALSVADKEQTPTMLWIGGIQNSFFPTDGDYERSALICAGASHPKRILVIGLGGGNTAYFMTQIPNVQEIVIVELMEDLGAFLNRYVSATQKTLDDPRVRYHGDDGRRYLYANPYEKFDLIFIDPLNSFTAGHNNLYSQEAMRLYQAHLSEGGVFCGWINESHILPKTVASAYPFADHFRGVMVAGNQPLVYDRSLMDRSYLQFMMNSGFALDTAVADRLAPEKILHRLRDRTGILTAEKHTPILTDMNAWLEYYYFHEPYRR